MTRNCCSFVIPVLGVLLVTGYTASLQNRIVVADYNYKDYQQDYQNYQPVGKYDKTYNDYQQDYQNYQPVAKYDKSFNDYQNYQNFRPVAKFDRPIVVKAIEKPKNEQDFSKIPGIPGVDFPLYHTVPPTSFSCAHVPFVPGMYANVETGCQAYHICHDGREGHQGASFLCTNGTLFNQKDFGCDWWYNVNCAEAPALYRLNEDPLKNPFVPKEKKDSYRKLTRIVVV
ncbi:uncharacterized protein LOC117602432 [Osmia lignaria lignaria]|uniref:uncharacterized protein LOC117602432 n=1 Tax=Osmia lignaria lignaria TaxID=1437193 RepID=UPI00402BC790